MKESELIERLVAGQLQLPPLTLRLKRLMDPRVDGRNCLDLILEAEAAGQAVQFAGELNCDAKPRTLQLAVARAKTYVGQAKTLWPLVLAPFLDDAKLRGLLQEGVSAIDFCGNGTVEVPGKFYVFRSGQLNQFKEQNPLRSAYRGDTSLVARALLLRRFFNAIGDIGKFIVERGGRLTFSTVSKALKSLEEDLVIERPSRGSVRLIQAERLLDQLEDQYQPPKMRAQWLGKVAVQPDELNKRLMSTEDTGQTTLVRTGASSVGTYATFADEPVLEFYCREEPKEVLSRLKTSSEETRRFPNLRLIQTDDQRVYFDRRHALLASPIQVWLELQHGDKRQQDAAIQVRQRLQRDVEATSV